MEHTQSSSTKRREPIAIVGSACRFPGGSSSPSKLWELLRQPRDVLKEIPSDRFNVNGFYHPDNMHHGTSNVRHSYLLDEDIRVFDSEFFGIKPVEANSIDPQQRLLMETVYEGIEAAGFTINGMRGSQTAVYVGLMSNDYADMLGNDQEYFPTYFATGTARSIVSNRVSYFFDWHGPSMTIDTACSSSLVAVHQAVQVLRSGDGTEVAVAAGTNLLLNPDQYIAESKLKMLSPDGRSRMWDEKANGYARGDGIAVVVLKTLSKAIRDGDHIECLIRETQTNQDGKTKGITMPSPSAQTALIRDTYKQAGLDLTKPSDRPQFFEAHGTGTPAGDPVEAEAIHTAFFGPDKPTRDDEHGNQPLYVGSIKTIIGHTEGTAGLAALIKASQALQSGWIPPNLLLDKVNPKVQPFYGDLQIVSQAIPWPNLAPGAVRRASVNSFGFGGSNAHAILEAYDPPVTKAGEQKLSSMPVHTALNISAASESALRAILKQYADYLEKKPNVSLRCLASTLNTRRSTFAARTSVFSSTPSQLIQRLRERSEADKSVLCPVAPRSLSSKPGILGIFTGQGAQWKRMGAELLSTSPQVVLILNQLEKSLSELPDGPSFSLKDELLADETSRVNEAAISQPLCTAVQVMLVDLLYSAGIQFESVVGHSSGEIGAAYAAGYISASDAIRIAYYRGLHLHLAEGPGGEKGAMMAAGTSWDDAQELCALRAFRGRLGVAASNSSASVTLSGDSDVVQWAKEVLEDEKKFARLLKVDKAYHSHHMLACSDAYRKSLIDCGIKVLRPHRRTTWISTVYGEDAVHHRHEIDADYWISNMCKPVLFSQGVEFALAEHGAFDMAIECGPHPALKGPALQVIQEVNGDSIPYTGLLSRGKSDREALAEGLGYLWQALGENAVDSRSFDKFLAGPGAPDAEVVTNLPSYAWDHHRAFWHESRQYAANRLKPHATHELLGTKCPDGTVQQHRWRNMLRPKEIPWLAGHQIQDQMVFPAAGYVSAAFEAVKLVTEGRSLKSMEIQDFIIDQAIGFNDEYSSVETQFTLTDIHVKDDRWRGLFSFYSASPKNPGVMHLNASGKIKLAFGEQQSNLLPVTANRDYNMIEIDSDRFYKSLAELGFGYTGPFKALNSLKRRMGVATGTISNPSSTDPAHDFLIHPATFDNAIQSIILAYCYPNDNRLWSVHLPTSIKRIRLNPLICQRYAGKEAVLCFRSTITSDRSTQIEGDVDVYDKDGQSSLMQLEGLQTKSLANATEANDSPLFLETLWDMETPNRKLAVADRPNMTSKKELSFDVERVAFYYLRHLDSVATKADRDNAQHHHKIFFEYIDHTVADVKRGTAKFAQREWMYDTHDDILALIRKYPDSLDMKLMHAVGEHLIPVIRHETTMLEYMREDNLLNDFYVHAVGFDEYTESLAQQVTQLSHRYPHMNILEIGAGTGGATKRIFKKLGKRFATYTYTDISAGFFEKTRETFSSFESKMKFKVLDAEKDPVEQGFKEHSYDLVVASLVLHATHDMAATMKNVRRLLKPGGYVIMLELGDYIEMRTGLIFGSLPGWWMGYDDGRKLSPCLSEDGWSDCMRTAGFSGVDAVIPIQEHLPVSLAVITGQAVDDRIQFLRDPLSPGSMNFAKSHLTIVGGSTDGVDQLVGEISAYLRPFYENILTVKSLSELNTSEVPFMGSVLCLTDLDTPLFKDMREDVLLGAQQLLKQSGVCLWVTQGAKDSDPYQNMSVGLTRVVKLEMTHLRLQSLDFDPVTTLSAHQISQRLLQFDACCSWEQSGEVNDLLWSVEPEVALERGNVIIPRLMPNPIRNARYNSSRRWITRDQEPLRHNLHLRWSGDRYEIHDEGAIQWSGPPVDGRVQLEVTHCTLDAIGINSSDFAYLVVGRNMQTQEQVIGLSPDRSSVVRVFSSWTIPYSMSTEKALSLLPAIRTNLMASAAVSRLSSGDTLILVEPQEAFAHALMTTAVDRAVRLVCLTSRTDAKGDNWVYLHSNAPTRAVRAAIPSTASWVIIDSTQGGLASNVLECLPPNCKVLDSKALCSKESKLDTFTSMAFIPSTLRSAFVRAHNMEEVQNPPMVTAASDMSPENQPSSDTTILSWNSKPTVPVKVTPVDEGNLFSSEKTYWLVGLSGGLGLSLCEWMVKHGAKYIAITSRNPRVDASWAQNIAAQGATVNVYSNDITDRESVLAVYKKICNELPPIGGIAQGAMVLADAMFVDLDLERVEKVIGPKVKGSIILDEIFSNVDLEFFVFFSSMAYVTGNQGQSIYAAANAYMASLAAQRRRRGVAGSVINIGTIIGNGYVTRQLTVAQQEYLTHMGNVFMSEQDFHQIFAEAIVAGRSGSKDIPEIMTGLRLAHMDDADQVTWFHNPKFSHCVLWREEQGSQASTSAKKNVSVRSQLVLATTPDEVREAIEGSLAAKLRTSLQIDPSVSVIDKNADQLGLDSLVAVDIRSWFIKELNVEMPVLKILGGFTVAEIIASAQEKLSDALIPNLGKELDPALKAVAQERVEVSPQQERKQVEANSYEFTALEEDGTDDEQDARDAFRPNSIISHAPVQHLTQPSRISEIEPSKFNFNEQGSKRVGFDTGLLTPLTEDPPSRRSGSSSNDSPFDSESDVSSVRKAKSSAATSITALDKYNSHSDNNAFERIVPMSFGQTRFWFLKFYLQDQTTFNITTCIRLTGSLSIARLKKAVRHLGLRHEALRTAFFTDGNQRPMQGVLKAPRIELEYNEGVQDAVREYVRVKNHEYDICRGETMRIVLIPLTENVHQLIIGYHHINMDGISLEVIIKDLQQLYDNKSLPAVPVQYPDFSLMQHKEFSDGEWGNELAYWKSEFATIPEPLPILPPSKKTSRAPLATYRSNTVKIELDSSLASQIEATCRRIKVSPFNFYLATFKVLLYRLAGGKVTDICIGMADGGRNNDLVTESIGFFLNLLPIRFQQQSSQVFSEALKETRSKVITALANSKVPFDVLLNEVHAPRTSTSSPLFQAFINYREGVQEKRQFCGCDSEAIQFDGSQTAYDLSLDILSNAKNVIVYFAGQSSLYNESDVALIAQSYIVLLKAFAKNPALRINRPSLYDSQATREALNAAKGRTQISMWPNTLIHRVDDMVKAHGSKTALRTRQTRLTYSQMAERTNAVGATLLSNDIGKGSRVGILQDPTVDFYCTLLAILRIGGTFVPLEPSLTMARLSDMVEDSQLDAIVYDKPNQATLARLEYGFKRINVSLALARSSEVIPNSASAEGTAIILYTSGSTGKPKGILLSHESWRNQIESSSSAWRIPVGAGVHLKQSAWSFDISMSQTFVALANGGSLFIVPKELRGDSVAISRLIVSEEVSHVQATPSELSSWLRNGDLGALRNSKWQFAMTGGERMTLAVIDGFRKLSKDDLKLFNAYGPAEATLAVGSVEVMYMTDDELDTPFELFPNYSIYILDSQKEPVPAGIPGEIYIGGVGVAQGYLNHDTLTKERFLPDDFAPVEYSQYDWTTMHKSGDRGYVLSDGRLSLDGRVDGDTQVKLRGIRIDLRDIESTMIQQAKGTIQDAIVSIHSSNGTEYLAAHVVMSPTFSGESHIFLERLRTSLPIPQYMQPAVVTALDQLPTNYSGKVDRKAISKLSMNLKEAASRMVPQGGSLLAKLTEIWLQVLGEGLSSLHRIDSDADFFHVGGSSLSLVELQAKINKTFNTDIPLIQLFENSTLGAMARKIDPAADSLPTSTGGGSVMPASVNNHDDLSTKPRLDGEASQINWEQETGLTDDFYDIDMNSEPKDQGLPYKTVVITGATGFLGKALMRRMLNDNNIDRIHAIALRRHRSDLPAIFSDPKVQLHMGDLNAPRLGLSQAAAQEIFDETDAVIHNGADTSFMKSYRTLSKTNLGSTRELVKLCLPQRIPMHFVSSASVAHLSGQPSFGEESVANFEPPRDGSDGYTATKWASERFLELVSEKFSIPIWIHRPSSITGDDAPALDLMTNLLSFSKKLQIAPSSPAWQGTLDFVDVDVVAAEIVDEVKNDSAHPGGLVKYMYESGDVEIAIGDMKGSLEDQTGGTFETLSLEEWTKKAVAAGLNELVAAYLVGASELPIVFPKLLRRTRPRVVKEAPTPSTSSFSLRNVVGRWWSANR